MLKHVMHRKDSPAVRIGATRAQEDMANLPQRISDEKIPPTVILDFTGIEAVNGSYVRASVAWLLNCSIAARVGKPANNPSPLDPWEIRAMPIQALFVANLSPEVREEIDLLFKQERLPCLVAVVPVVPHVYAETDFDWERWAIVLKNQPQINTIAIEFQTGLGVESKAHRYIEKLSELRAAIGRPLHIIAVGGTRHSSKLNEVFPLGYTLTDATSFMKTVRRRRVDHGEPEHRQLDSQDDLSDLLQKNIESREKRLRRKLRLSPPVHFSLAA